MTENISSPKTLFLIVERGYALDFEKMNVNFVKILYNKYFNVVHLIKCPGHVKVTVPMNEFAD